MTKNMLLLLLPFSSISCLATPPTMQLGNSDICVPREFIVNLGPRSSDSNYDSGPEVYEALNIETTYLQKYIPNYVGAFGNGNDRRWYPLMITITQNSSYIPMYPSDEDSKLTVSAKSPHLLALHPEELSSMETFDTSQVGNPFWGICSFLNLNSNAPLDCDRRLSIKGLDFDYTISRSNIDLYKEIDQFLIDKVKEWQCR